MKKQCGMGIFIDIYPLDGLGNDLEKAEKKWLRLKVSLLWLIFPQENI